MLGSDEDDDDAAAAPADGVAFVFSSGFFLQSYCGFQFTFCVRAQLDTLLTKPKQQRTTNNNAVVVAVAAIVE